MALTPPNGFVMLDSAVNHTQGVNYSVIGVCVDFLPAARSRGSDETIKFTLSDTSWFRDRGMNFRYFSKTHEGLPAIRNTGDVVVLKNVSTRVFGSSPIGLSNYGTFWFVLSGSSVRGSTCPNGTDIEYAKPQSVYNNVQLSLAELQYAKALAASVDPSSFSLPAQPTQLQTEFRANNDNGRKTTSRKDKWRLLKDLDLDKNTPGNFSDGQPAFADLFGEVRRMYTGGYSCVDLYLCDYTSNPRFYSYDYSSEAPEGDQYGYSVNQKAWQGPWGKMTIKIFLWDAHGAFVQANVKERMFVFIKNCHIKMDRDGQKLEAVCRGDRNDSSRVNVAIYHTSEAVNDERFRDLLQRKKDYETSALKQGLPIGPPDSDSKTKRRSSALEEPVKETKSKRKKANKRAKEAAAALKQGKPAMLANQHVRCEQVDIPPTSIEQVLNLDLLKRTTPAGNEYHLPFQNAAYKCNVRVVDYYPDDIAQFAIPREKLAKRNSPGHQQDGDDDSDEFRDIDFEDAYEREHTTYWEWRFMLVLEDANSSGGQTKSRLPVLVAGKHGDCLLNENACDLDNESANLARIREKLFFLWGDLQERKEEAAMTGAELEQGRPQQSFECLIQEYGSTSTPLSIDSGVRPEYQRRFQMFGTTIG